MITNIDIDKFGQFNDFKWQKCLNNIAFKEVNIIYGRNYSGKTTLSRIFRCMEKGEVHRQYQNGIFNIACRDGSVISEGTLSGVEDKYRIRVYNTDFVNEHLSWLRNEAGDILPFTILGLKNNEIEKKIASIDEKLGSIESKRGLVFERQAKEDVYKKKHEEYARKRDRLQSTLKNKANDSIKINPHFFVASATKKTYTITDLKREITTVLASYSKYFLRPEEIKIKEQLLTESSLPNLAKLPCRTHS